MKNLRFSFFGNQCVFHCMKLLHCSNFGKKLYGVFWEILRYFTNWNTSTPLFLMRWYTLSCKIHLKWKKKNFNSMKDVLISRKNFWNMFTFPINFLWESEMLHEWKVYVFLFLCNFSKFHLWKGGVPRNPMIN